MVPWTLYQRHGDAQILADQWDSMTPGSTAFEARAGEGLDFPDGGFMFGDWLDTAAPPDNPAAARTPWPCVATAYLARSAQIMAEAAEILGPDGRAGSPTWRTGRRSDSAREYVTPNGRLAFAAQTAYALALEFDLLHPNSGRQAGRAARRSGLADGFHIATGFLGTPFVSDALTEAGEFATAYELLLQRENPSWLYPVTMGATTIWERWDSMLPDGSINPGDMTSFNHYAFGAVADWLHRTVGRSGPRGPGVPAAAHRPAAGSGHHVGRRDTRDSLRHSGSGVDAGRTARLHRGRHRSAEHHRRGVAARRQRAGRGRLRPALVLVQHSEPKRVERPERSWTPPE